MEAIIDSGRFWEKCWHNVYNFKVTCLLVGADEVKSRVSIVSAEKTGVEAAVRKAIELAGAVTAQITL